MPSPSTTTGDGTPAPAPVNGDGGPDGPPDPDDAGPRSAPAPSERAGGRWAYVVVALLAYVPMLATKPGVVSDDTKTYLYLDPGKWVRTSASIWDPFVALGSVTHETIGYLFPMGPFYWFFSAVNIPTWIAQRLWLGSLLFAAAAGVLYLCDTIGLAGAGRLVAAVAYGFTPYVLQYSGRISVILMPFAGLPFLLAFVIRGVRRPDWKYPALFGVTLALISGINASSVIYVGVAPVLWLPYAVLVAREATGRAAWRTCFRVGVLSVLVSLWWIVGLAVEGGYGINVLRYTESVQATSSTSNLSDVIRGLGYWYFYGGDRMGTWTPAAVEYTQKLWLIALSYALPVVAFAGAVLARWRYRAFFVLMVVVGVALSVGAYPYDHPTGFGALAKAFMTKTTAGLALRSTDRATPLVVLGLAMLAGMGVAAATARLSARRGWVLGGAVITVLLLAAAPLLAGRTVVSQFSQPASPPPAVREAAAHLNATHPGTRVYALPGNNFAAERWGDTIDPVWPAVLDRPFVTREQQIQGSLATADLLFALDAPLQQGTMDWSAFAPIARLMSVGDVIVDEDQQYERYDTPRPALLHQQLASTPRGLSDPRTFGTPTRNRSTIPQLDETYYRLPPGTPNLPPITTYTVSRPRPIARAESLAHPLVVDGDANGLVAAAGVGLLGADPTVLYAGTLDEHPALARQVRSGPADLVVTDSNRKAAFEWNSLNDNLGETETAAQKPNAFVANDPPLDLFPGLGPSSQTTAVLHGVRSVSASSYGTATTLRPEWRPANAIDGNLSTAWETEGTTGVPNGAWWQVTLDHRVHADSVTLTQPVPVANEADYSNQYITRVTLTFDGRDPVTVDLGPPSRQPGGQVVPFPVRTFSTLRIRIDATNLSTGTSVPAGSSLVGLAEVGIGQVRAVQVVKVPSDLLARAGAAAATDRLTYLFTRDRVAPVPPRADPEPTLVRQFSVPSTRRFAVTGTARVSTAASDPLVDTTVGRTSSTADVVTATSSERMPGDAAATASATLDGNPATAWSPGLGGGAQVGSWLDYTFRAPTTVDHLDLTLVSDAEHSRPTSVTVTGDDGSHTLALPPVPVTAPAGSTTTVPLAFPALTGTNLRITFDTIQPRTSVSYETSLVDTLPIAVAEVAMPGVTAAALPAQVPTTCRSDLLTLDGRPLWTSVAGSAQGALAGNGLVLSLCGPDAAGITLGTGTHLLRSAPGAVTGLNVDQLVLDSAAVRAGTTVTAAGPAAPSPTDGMIPSAPSGAAGAPVVHVVSQSSTAWQVHLTGATRATAPFVLILGESLDRGWAASVGGAGSLGTPYLVDGFANGWTVDAATLAAADPHGTGTLEASFRFTPQRMVDVALLVSAAALLACLLVLALIGLRRRRRRGERGAAGTGDGVALDVTVPGDAVDGRSPRDAVPQPEPLRGAARGFVRARVLPTVAAAVVLGGGAWAVGGAFAGVVAAVGVVLTLTVVWGRTALRVAAVALMAGGALDVVLHQERYRYPPGGWPTQFDRAATLMWGAVMLLAADAALEMVRRWRAGRSTGAARPDPAGAGPDDTLPPEAPSPL